MGNIKEELSKKVSDINVTMCEKSGNIVGVGNIIDVVYCHISKFNL